MLDVSNFSHTNTTYRKLYQIQFETHQNYHFPNYRVKFVKNVENKSLSGDFMGLKHNFILNIKSGFWYLYGEYIDVFSG